MAVVNSTSHKNPPAKENYPLNHINDQQQSRNHIQAHKKVNNLPEYWAFLGAGGGGGEEEDTSPLKRDTRVSQQSVKSH